MKNSSQRKSLLGDIIRVLTGNIVAMVAVLVLNIILSRSLGPAGYGVFNGLLVVAMISGALVQMGIHRSAVVHLGRKDYPSTAVLGSVATLWLVASIMAMLASLVTYFILQNQAYSVVMILLVITGIPFAIGVIYLSGCYLGLDRVKQANRLYYSAPIINVVLTLIMVVWFRLGVTGALLATLISSVTVFSITVARLRKEFYFRFTCDRELLVSLVKLGMVYAFTFILLQLNYKVDILLLQKMVSSADVGYYTLAVSVSEQLWLLPYAAGLVLMSRTANSDSRENAVKPVGPLLRWGFLLSIIGSLAIVYIAPILVPLIFGRDFSGSVAVVKAIIPGIVAFVVFRILESNLAGLGKPWLAVYALLPSLLINVVLNFILIPKFGILGSAWATNISYIVATVIYLITYVRYTRMTIFNLLMPKRSDWVELKEAFGKGVGRFGRRG